MKLPANFVFQTSRRILFSVMRALSCLYAAHTLAKRVSLFSSKISCFRVVSDTRSLSSSYSLSILINTATKKERKSLKKFRKKRALSSDGGGLHRGCEDEIVRQQDFPFVCFHLELLLLMLLCLLSNSMNEFFHAADKKCTDNVNR